MPSLRKPEKTEKSPNSNHRPDPPIQEAYRSSEPTRCHPPTVDTPGAGPPYPAPSVPCGKAHGGSRPRKKLFSSEGPSLFNNEIDWRKPNETASNRRRHGIGLTLIAVDASTSFAQKVGMAEGRQQASRAGEHQVRWLHHQSSANANGVLLTVGTSYYSTGTVLVTNDTKIGSTAHKPPPATCDWVTMQKSSCFGLHGWPRTSRSLGLARALPRFLGATNRTMGLRHSDEFPWRSMRCDRFAVGKTAHVHLP